MDLRGLSIMIIVLISSVCAAVLGTATKHLITVVLPSAAGTSPPTTTTAAVFGLRAVLGGLYSPFSLFFPFYPHSLFFNFSLFPA